MTPPDLSGFTHAQKDALIGTLFEQIARLEQEILQLKARLGMGSRDSSKPPSSDGHEKPPAPNSTREKSGKPSGGQREHGGSTLGRVAEPDQVLEHRPEHCAGCVTSLADVEEAPIDTEWRQVFDQPPRRLVVTEHRLGSVRCPCCRAHCRGVFPAGVEQAVQYGPGVQARVLYLSPRTRYNRTLTPTSKLCCLSSGTAIVTRASAGTVVR